MSEAARTTFEARVWNIEKVQGARGTTHKVLWKVGPKRWKKSFKTAALADSYRSKLVTAVRQGEAFDLATGEPVSMVRARVSAINWYEFACQHVDAKWNVTSPNHRMGTANVHMSVTTALLADQMPPDEQAARAIRSALINWGFNARRGSEDQPADATERLTWVARNSPTLSELSDTRVMRRLLQAFGTKLDGTRASGRTSAWRRSVLTTALNYAVEEKLLDSNPVDPSA